MVSKPAVATVLALGTYAFLTLLTFNRPLMTGMFVTHFSGPIVWALSLYALIAAVRFATKRNVSPVAWLRRHLWDIISAASLTAATFLYVPARLRILEDEASLADVARSLAQNARGWEVLMAYYRNSVFEPIAYTIPKRPFLYPAWTAVLHVLTGFRIENAFLLNGLLFFAFSLAVFTITRKAWGRWAAWGVALLVCAQPIVLLCVTSGGIDFFSAAALMGCLALAELYRRRPDVDLCRLLILVLILFCHIRYENFALALAIAGALAFARTWRRDDLRTNLPLLAMIPLFLLPISWQRYVSMEVYSEPAGEALFSLLYIPGHFVHMLSCFFVPSSLYPFAVLANILGIGAAVAGGVRSVRKTWRAWLPAAVGGGGLFVILFSNWFGSAGDTVSARWFVGPAIWAALGTAWALSRLTTKSVRGPLLFVAGVAACCLYAPQAQRGTFYRTLFAADDTESVGRFLDGLESQKPKVLFISSRPLIFAARGFAVLTPFYGGSNPDLIRTWQKENVKEVFLMERLPLGDKPMVHPLMNWNSVDWTGVLPDDWKRTEVASWPVTGGNYRIRVSRITQLGKAIGTEALGPDPGVPYSSPSSPGS